MKKSLEAEKVFHDVRYDNYLVEYRGNIEAEISQIPDYYLTIINDRYAIVSVIKDVEINMGGEPNIKSIVYVAPSDFYTLQDITPVEASQARYLQVGSELNLTGKGINIAIIDSGIDYLNEEFTSIVGDTRIEEIWDQTILDVNNESTTVPFGVTYNKSRINDALIANRNGGNPYAIVPSTDEIGHGTNMAGIIGATGKNPKLKGVAYDCNFIIVKLIPDYSYKAQFPEITIPVFNITAVYAAFQHVYEYALNSNIPTVVYFPLGSNLGSHNGLGILAGFIDLITSSEGIAIVTPTGNQKDKGVHTSGTSIPFTTIKGQPGGIIEFVASPEQSHLWIEIWVDLPNVMFIEVISPSGESTGIIAIVTNYTANYTYIFEKTSIRANYYLPEETTGDELIRIRFYNLRPGIWRIRLYGYNITTGKYNAWMPQNGITIGGTRFSFADPFGTVTNPSTSIYSVTVAAYNQNNNNLVDFSGNSFLDAYIDRIDVAAGGVNAITVAPGNKTAVVSGTSVSAAVVSGICAMIFQWGIINGNEPRMFAQTIKSYLASGTVIRSGDLIPNPYWGYGIVNVPKIFENRI